MAKFMFKVNYPNNNSTIDTIDDSNMATLYIGRVLNYAPYKWKIIEMFGDKTEVWVDSCEGEEAL